MAPTRGRASGSRSRDTWSRLTTSVYPGQSACVTHATETNHPSMPWREILPGGDPRHKWVPLCLRGVRRFLLAEGALQSFPKTCKGSCPIKYDFIIHSAPRRRRRCLRASHTARHPEPPSPAASPDTTWTTAIKRPKELRMPPARHTRGRFHAAGGGRGRQSGTLPAHASPPTPTGGVAPRLGCELETPPPSDCDYEQITEPEIPPPTGCVCEEQIIESRLTLSVQCEQPC